MSPHPFSRAFTLGAVVLAALAAPRTAAATQCAQLPVLFIIQDTSGSMAQSPSAGGGGQSKWQIAASTVPQLVSDYSNRFQFGMYMFPSDNLCSPGLVVNGVPSTPAQIQASFNGAGPGGGTPTAVAIQQVQQYLASLQLSVPAYILVVTDGEPNCNTGLDGATCTCTSNDYIGCNPAAVYCDANGQNCSYGNQLNCLDGNRTEVAAANAHASGFPVYVVGFGSQTDVYNNKQVLDAIAQGGGTSQSLMATDQASLQAALDAIAGSITTCCTDACAQGQTRCSAAGTSVDSCVLDTASGCYEWVHTESCAANELCVLNPNATCSSCSTSCTAGETRCSGNEVDTCVVDASGCPQWQSTQVCGSGEICASGACTNGCSGCSPGEVQCSGSEIQSCVAQAGGCSGWVTTQTCGSGELCIAGAGAAQCCANACAPGSSRCAGDGTVEICSGAPGTCPSWQASACAAGSTCIDGHCDVPCNTQGELVSCPAGTRCAQAPQGAYCEPIADAGAPGASASDGGATSGHGAPDAGPAASKKPAVRASGCASTDGLALLALLPALALVRRRR